MNTNERQAVSGLIDAAKEILGYSGNDIEDEQRISLEEAVKRVELEAFGGCTQEQIREWVNKPLPKPQGPKHSHSRKIPNILPGNAT